MDERLGILDRNLRNPYILREVDNERDWATPSGVVRTNAHRVRLDRDT